MAGSLLTSLQPLRNLLPGVNAGSLVWSLAPGGGSSGEAPPGVIDAVTGGRATLAEQMVGNGIQKQFLNVLAYPTAAALSFILMALILGVVTVYMRKAGTEDLV